MSTRRRSHSTEGCATPSTQLGVLTQVAPAEDQSQNPVECYPLFEESCTRQVP